MIKKKVLSQLTLTFTLLFLFSASAFASYFNGGYDNYSTLGAASYITYKSKPAVF